MSRVYLEQQAGQRNRRRTFAAAVLASSAVAILFVAMASRDPLRPLRALARGTLVLRGARFVTAGRAREQSSLNDCGPTALADLLELTGRPVPSADSLRRLSSTRPGGTTLGDLGFAAGVSGLALFTVQWDPSELALLPLPSLVWVEKRHFVVVARRPRPDSVEVLDPATGRYRMTSARFAKLWSGAALVLLDSITPRRSPDTGSGPRPHRARGTRASTANIMED